MDILPPQVLSQDPEPNHLAPVAGARVAETVTGMVDTSFTHSGPELQSHSASLPSHYSCWSWSSSVSPDLSRGCTGFLSEVKKAGQSLLVYLDGVVCPLSLLIPSSSLSLDLLITHMDEVSLECSIDRAGTKTD